MIWSSLLIPLVSLLGYPGLIVSVIFTDLTENCRILSLYFFLPSLFHLVLCAQHTTFMYMQVLLSCILFDHSG